MSSDLQIIMAIYEPYIVLIFDEKISLVTLHSLFLSKVTYVRMYVRAPVSHPFLFLCFTSKYPVILHVTSGTFSDGSLLLFSIGSAFYQ